MPASKQQAATIISPEKFSGLMSLLGIDFSVSKNLAVAVSGGGDSIALTMLLANWAKDKGISIHALTVDHGLRPESTEEAKTVSRILKPFGISHKILTWEGKKPKTRIQELARQARYQLMSDYCLTHRIPYLCVAHHAQDQMETILFRMAKGTGIDGLAGMRPVHILENGLIILRPLLSLSHEDLLATLKSENINWIEDPSNKNNVYARVRMRQTLQSLENEGLSSTRISSLSNRIIQSVQLIDYFIEKEYSSILLSMHPQHIEIDFNRFLDLPIEGKIRILALLISKIHEGISSSAFSSFALSAPRLEDIERLAHKINTHFKGATLGHCAFQRKKEKLEIRSEKLT